MKRPVATLVVALAAAISAGAVRASVMSTIFVFSTDIPLNDGESRTVGFDQPSSGSRSAPEFNNPIDQVTLAGSEIQIDDKTIAGAAIAASAAIDAAGFADSSLFAGILLNRQIDLTDVVRDSPLLQNVSGAALAKVFLPPPCFFGGGASTGTVRGADDVTSDLRAGRPAAGGEEIQGIDHAMAACIMAATQSPIPSGRNRASGAIHASAGARGLGPGLPAPETTGAVPDTAADDGLQAQDFLAADFSDNGQAGGAGDAGGGGGDRDLTGASGLRGPLSGSLLGNGGPLTTPMVFTGPVLTSPDNLIVSKGESWTDFLPSRATILVFGGLLLWLEVMRRLFRGR